MPRRIDGATRRNGGIALRITARVRSDIRPRQFDRTVGRITQRRSMGGDDDDTTFGRELAQSRPECGLTPFVLGRGRLVEEQQPAVTREQPMDRAGRRDALRLTAGEPGAARPESPL